MKAKSRACKLSKPALVRERLERSPSAIAGLVGSVDGLPAQLSSRRKEYLRATGYGRKRSR